MAQRKNNSGRPCKRIDYHSASSLTDYQKHFIRMHAGLVPKKVVAEKLKIKESAATDYIRRMKLDLTSHGKIEYRKEITNITRFQICICDFEGYLPEAIGKLYCIYPSKVKYLLEEMKESGEYDRHIATLEEHNEGAYNKAMHWRTYAET